MRNVDYRLWCPDASPLRVEFPAELVRSLGSTEASGILYGSRCGRVIWVWDAGAESGETPGREDREKVGVFVSRIRGEVFLTETDLAFFTGHKTELALVIAGTRAGFFVREANGSIQTVRSHEEFSMAESSLARQDATPGPQNAVPRRAPRPAVKRTRTFVAAGLVMLASLPIAALAMLPRRAGRTEVAGQAPTSSALDVDEAGGQLRISWKPGQNAMLAIDDGGRRLSIPVYADQSSVTFATQGSEVEVSLLTVDAANQPHRESALYLSSAGSSAEH